jgi:hypothetical protein
VRFFNTIYIQDKEVDFLKHCHSGVALCLNCIIHMPADAGSSRKLKDVLDLSENSPFLKDERTLAVFIARCATGLAPLFSILSSEDSERAFDSIAVSVGMWCYGRLHQKAAPSWDAIQHDPICRRLLDDFVDYVKLIRMSRNKSNLLHALNTICEQVFIRYLQEASSYAMVTVSGTRVVNPVAVSLLVDMMLMENAFWVQQNEQGRLKVR